MPHVRSYRPRSSLASLTAGSWGQTLFFAREGTQAENLDSPIREAPIALSYECRNWQPGSSIPAAARTSINSGKKRPSREAPSGTFDPPRLSCKPMGQRHGACLFTLSLGYCALRIAVHMGVHCFSQPGNGPAQVLHVPQALFIPGHVALLQAESEVPVRRPGDDGT